MIDEHTPVGDYVTGVAYREMRLRMLLTGTASPTEEQWAEALGNLLAELPALREEAAEVVALRAEVKRLRERVSDMGWAAERARDAEDELDRLKQKW